MGTPRLQLPNSFGLGVDGKSAYELAVQHGFEGDERAWLDSLKGPPYTLTEADKAEIVQSVLESIGATLYGYLDSDNNIVLTGALPNDKYYIKYTMDGGDTVDIGELDTNIYYSVTNKLTSCTNNNSTTEVIKDKSYSATISAYSGYALSSLVVTMGGTDVTSSAVSGGNIDIASVTGDIVITAVAELAEVRTNFFDASSGFAGRLSSTGADRTDAVTAYVTNYIPVQSGDVVLISGCTISAKFAGSDDYFFMTGYNSSKTNVYTGTAKNGGGYWTVDPLTSVEAQLTVLNANIAYMRLVCAASAYHDISIDTSGIAVDTSKIVINIKRNGEWL